MNARRSSDPFETLVREHHAAVYRAALRILLNVDDAQDVTQQVFLQALEKREQLDDAEKPCAVLCWMASRTALMHLRGDRRRRQREAERAVMNRDGGAHDVRDGKLDQDERTLFERIFRRLPEELRIAISLRFQDEMTYEQIGEVMTVSVASAHDRVRRGLERLREGLKRGGLGAFAIDLERHLAEAPAEPVPAGLAERLLGLKGAALVSGDPVVLGSALGGLALLAGGLGVALWVDDVPGDAEAPAALVAVGEREALTLPAVETTSPPRVALGGGATGAPTSSGVDSADEDAVVVADDRSGTISGVVTVPDGGPAEGVTVVAGSYVIADKMSAWGGRSATDANGRYEIVVPVRHDSGEDYRVYVKYDEAIIARAGDTRVPPNGSIEDFDIVLERPLDETNGEFELDLEVRDEQGMLLPADSIVILHRNLRTIGEGTWPRWETSGRLDAGGRVLLCGAKLGPKKVTARFRRDDVWKTCTATLELSAAGRSARVVTVTPENTDYAERSATQPAAERPPGFSMTGTMTELGSGRPIERSYPDVWVYPVPELSSADFHYDFLPNLLFRDSFQTATFGEDPEPSSHFQSRVREPGRWVAVGHEHPFAPAISEVVFLSEEMPAAEGLQLRFERAGVLTGVVYDVDGAPLEGAIVFITGTGPISTEKTKVLDGRVRKNAGAGVFIEPIHRTDAKGRFEIGGLPSSVPVRVMAFHPERAPMGSPMVYAASGVTIDGLDLRFVTVRER